MFVSYEKDSLVKNIKNKIENDENLIIYDDNYLLPEIEPMLIHNHYFYFTLSNLKFNLLEEMKEDKFHLKVFDSFLFFNFFEPKLNPTQIMIYREILNNIIQEKNIESFDDLYNFFLYSDYSLDYNPEMKLLENLFVHDFCNRTIRSQISNKKLLFRDLEQEKTCIIIFNNFEDKILKFLFYYLSAYFSEKNKKENLNFVIFSKHEKTKNEIVFEAAKNEYEIMIG